jgi:hypothetical protein
MCRFGVDSVQIIKTFILKKAIKFRLQILMLLVSTCMSVSAQNIPSSELLETDIKHTQQSDLYTLIETDRESFSVQFNPSQQALNKGLVIFIPDANSQLGQSTSLMALAHKLPQFGWSTVLMPSSDLADRVAEELAPDDNQQTQENQTEETEPDTAKTEAPNEEKPLIKELMAKVDFNPFREEAYESFEEVLSQRLMAVESNYQNVLGRRLIVTQGVSASTLLMKLQESSGEQIPVDALIINNPYFPVYMKNKQIPNLVAQISLPMFDIVSSGDNRWSHATQDKRRIAARIALRQNYRQHAPFGLSKHEDEINRLAKDIYGWTTYLGW